jgi:hypothetical protein
MNGWKKKETTPPPFLALVRKREKEEEEDDEGCVDLQKTCAVVVVVGFFHSFRSLDIHKALILCRR